MKKSIFLILAITAFLILTSCATPFEQTKNTHPLMQVLQQ